LRICPLPLRHLPGHTVTKGSTPHSRDLKRSHCANSVPRPPLTNEQAIVGLHVLPTGADAARPAATG